MKFSIVTPVYNMERYIDATIESVLSQEGNFDIEYIIMDGGSTDKTLSIAKYYEERLRSGDYKIACNGITFSIYSEKDRGMYDAINKGFSKATGDVYAWINADDIYEPGAFHHISEAMKKFPEVTWIKGIGVSTDEHGNPIPNTPRRTYIYRQDWLAGGMYGMQSYFVDQVSVFWRRKLWEQVAPIPTQYKLAGDYWLWIAFAQHEKLWSLSTPVARFRKREGQLSGNVSAYKAEQRSIQPKTTWRVIPVRMFFNPWSRLLPYFHSFFLWLYPIFFSSAKNDTYLEVWGERYSVKRAPSFAINSPKSS